jgi:long-chain acyl-CoA synthetase
MEKIWLKSYPKGVPAEINVNAYRSIPELIDQNVVKYRDRAAYRCMGKTITFADVDRLSNQFGAWLQSKGLAKGTRVAVMMPNVLQYPVAVFGILRAGYTVVNVNPLYTPRELEHQLKDSGAEAIVILENFATTLEKVLPSVPVKHIVVASLGDMLGVKGLIVNFVVRNVKKLVPAFNLPGAIRFNSMLSEAAGMTLKKPELGPEDIAFLQYTGGTTGLSKGAVLLHRNIIANMEQVSAWFAPTRDPNEPMIMVAPLPLYHIYALTCNCLYMLRDGGCCLLIPNPRDIPGFVKELKNNRFTAISGLNTLYNALLNHPEFKDIDFSHMRMSSAGGMAMTKAVADRWKGITNKPILEGYGLTETSPVATTNPADITDFTGTIGLPVPSTTITIRDDEEKILPVGQVGEICIAGPQVMRGYWQRPEETAKVMSKDGAFKTGDIGVMDERGYVTIVDRKKDMILVSGFNVYPNELEQVVSGMPGVLEVAAIGVPDEHSGEVPKLFIVKKDPSLTEEQVMAFCKEQLTGYKRPKYVEFRAELPKTNVGKILRRALRDEKKAA